MPWGAAEDTHSVIDIIEDDEDPEVERDLVAMHHGYHPVKDEDELEEEPFAPLGRQEPVGDVTHILEKLERQTGNKAAEELAMGSMKPQPWQVTGAEFLLASELADMPQERWTGNEGNDFYPIAPRHRRALASRLHHRRPGRSRQDVYVCLAHAARQSSAHRLGHGDHRP